MNTAPAATQNANCSDSSSASLQSLIISRPTNLVSHEQLEDFKLQVHAITQLRIEQQFNELVNVADRLPHLSSDVLDQAHKCILNAASQLRPEDRHLMLARFVNQIQYLPDDARGRAYKRIFDAIKLQQSDWRISLLIQLVSQISCLRVEIKRRAFFLIARFILKISTKKWPVLVGALVSQIGEFTGCRLRQFYADIVGVIAHSPIEDRRRLLVKMIEALVESLQDLPDATRIVAFSEICSIVGRLIPTCQGSSLAVLAEGVRKIPSAAQEQAFECVMRTVAHLPIVHRCEILEVLVSRLWKLPDAVQRRAAECLAYVIDKLPADCQGESLAIFALEIRARSRES
ncbi:hypothetical protein [Burkholderia sp. Bp8986]|uniref:hypothetical protein n=1 Tax=Burkholderia sp. Bp8986 TaxID=2184550 RepID=UPI000F5A2F24|nr:hypothetical protein [Burkholderia sp. Bp8986]